MHNGIDVSHHNGPIDWAHVTAEYAWCKVSEGTGNTDPTWPEHRAGARALGIPVGGYHFAQPGDPRQQARRFVALLGPASGYDLLPVLDAEVAGIDARWCDDFLREVEREIGATPIIYTSSLGPPYVVNDARLIRYRLWCADYGAPAGRPRCKRPWAVHQHSSTGRVPGVGGNVDLNVAPDLAAILMPHATHTGQPATKPTPSVDTPKGYPMPAFLAVKDTTQPQRFLGDNGVVTPINGLQKTVLARALGQLPTIAVTADEMAQLEAFSDKARAAVNG